MIRRIIQHHIGRLLPENLKNKLYRIRKWHAAKRHRAVKSSAIARHGTFNAAELVKVLRDAGIDHNSLLFAHCSFNDMLTFSGTPKDVLQALLALVGPSGTLLMPAYTSNTYTGPSRLFDVACEPTYAGVVNEIFRRSPGVIRSLHPRHSICGKGLLAKELLSGHDRCIRADGPDSPFDRLRKREEARILTLGLPPGFISFLHWIEDIDPSMLPFAIHKPRPVLCKVRNSDGNISMVKDWQLRDLLDLKNNYVEFSKNFSEKAMKYWSYKGVLLGLYSVKLLSEELMTLRDKGIVHYR